MNRRRPGPRGVPRCPGPSTSAGTGAAGRSRRRFAAGAAGAVLALTALIAVPAAGALGTSAGSTGPLRTTMSLSTTRWQTCGGGQVQPLCTRLPTTITSTYGEPVIDFETGTLEGWAVTNPTIKLRVVKGAAQAGRLGLRISNLDRASAVPAESAFVQIPEYRFRGGGELREVPCRCGRPGRRR